jgi:fructokinase
MQSLTRSIDSASRAPRTPRPVLVIGEALVDRFADGDVVGGAPFNVARSLAAFGVPTTFISRIGDDDDDGARVLASALRFGLHDAPIQRDRRRATGAATVIERHGDHRFEIHADAAWDHLDLNEARAALRAAAPGIVYFGTLAQRSETSARTIDALLERTAALRYLDLNLRPGQDNRDVARHSLARADWVSVNDDELRRLLVWFVPQADAAAADDSTALRDGIRCLMQHFSVARLIVTRGARGYAAFDLRGRCIAQGVAHAVTPLIDTVGAGDGFSAAFIALQSAGCTAAASLAAANRYAAALCGQRGALPEDAAFFRRWRAALGLQPCKPARLSAAH